jgi:gluconolactonase
MHQCQNNGCQTKREETNMAMPTRRGFVQLAAGGIGGAAFAKRAGAQLPTASPPSVVSIPPRDWGPHAPPAIYPDPDVVVLDPVFAQYRVGNAGIHRVATGFQWAEGPAWSSQGHYLVFSRDRRYAISFQLG